MKPNHSTSICRQNSLQVHHSLRKTGLECPWSHFIFFPECLLHHSTAFLDLPLAVCVLCTRSFLRSSTTQSVEIWQLGNGGWVLLAAGWSAEGQRQQLIYAALVSSQDVLVLQTVMTLGSVPSCTIVLLLACVHFSPFHYRYFSYFAIILLLFVVII